MIPQFSDHAANERTYLAWVRTAIAIIAFGFLIERFDLFLGYIEHNAVRLSPGRHLDVSECAGLLLILFGTAVILLATLRFLHHRRAIASEQIIDYGSATAERLFTAILACLGLFLLVYIGQQLWAIG